MIAFAEIDIGVGGTLACAACARRSPTVAAEPTDIGRIRESLVDTARSWGAGPGPNVAFVGFEPFAHPELPDIVRLAVDVGYQRVRLRTDAGALSMPGNAQGALGAGVRQIEVVLLADGDEHDRLAERPGLFAVVTTGVRAFIDAAASAGMPVAVTGLVPVCRHNAVHAPAAVARLAVLGAIAVHVDASACPKEDVLHVVAALDTAATNAVAASVSGLPVDVPVPWTTRPWTLVPVPEPEGEGA